MSDVERPPKLSQRQIRRNKVRAAAEAAEAERVHLKKPAVNGRPRALDPDQAALDRTMQTLISSAEIGCTMQETCALLGVGDETVSEFFVRYPAAREKYEDAKLTGSASVRRMQFKLAEKSPQMAIHLGEQLAGQRDPYKMREIEQRERALEIRERAVKVQEEALAMKAPDQSNFGSIDIRSLSLPQLIQLVERIRQEVARQQLPALPPGDVGAA